MLSLTPIKPARSIGKRNRWRKGDLPLRALRTGTPTCFSVGSSNRLAETRGLVEQVLLKCAGAPMRVVKRVVDFLPGIFIEALVARAAVGLTVIRRVRLALRSASLTPLQSICVLLLRGGVLPKVRRVSLADRRRRVLLSPTMSSCTSSYPDS